MTSPHPSWTGTGLSHQGQVRTSNQDAFAIDNDLGLWIVADGMGGYTGGQVASSLAVSAIMTHMKSLLTTPSLETDAPSSATTILSQAISAAKTALQAKIAEDPDLHSMGTTVVVAWFLSNPDPSIAIAHVGDSRAYRIRDTHLEPLTRDHSLVQQLLTDGHITQEQAQDHPKRNVIVRALGLHFPSTPDVTVHRLEPKDTFMLCTDGLTKMLSDIEIETILLQSPHVPEETCRQLIERTNTAGGTDNTTALLITPRAS